MILEEILRAKGTAVRKVAPDASLDDVIRELVLYNIGSLVVCEPASEGTPPCAIGIITERDILRAQAAHSAPLDQLHVASVMSSELVTAAPHDPIEDAMRLMTYRRVRHLPVVAEVQLLGIVSIGDIVKAHHDELALENHFMKSYIQGEGAEVGTLLS